MLSCLVGPICDHTGDAITRRQVYLSGRKDWLQLHVGKAKLAATEYIEWPLNSVLFLHQDSQSICSYFPHGFGVSIKYPFLLSYYFHGPEYIYFADFYVPLNLPISSFFLVAKWLTIAFSNLNMSVSSIYREQILQICNLQLAKMLTKVKLALTRPLGLKSILKPYWTASLY